MFKCKITKKNIKPFMSFGKMPLANNFLKKKDFKKEYFFEMNVGFNEDLSLFQLGKQPKAELMFNQNYPFYTGSSKFMIEHFKNFSKWLNKNYLSSNSRLIEIGSNDGTFLNNFKSTSINFLGVEPSKNMATLSNKKGIYAHNTFFSLSNVKHLKNFKNNTDVITAANVICHVKNLESLIDGVDYLLNPEGFFIFEEPYLGSMYEKVSYDQIYDEHVFMFSVHSIKKIFERYGFKLVDVLPQLTHGGSMRYVVTKKRGIKISPNVQKYLNYEAKNNIDNINGCLKFKNNCLLSKKKLTEKIEKIKNDNKKIVGYAATSKSTTILNYCEINKSHIDCIYDTTKEKIGKFTPGTHIPIFDMKKFQSSTKDYVYLFAWNHKQEIFKKEKTFTKNGGKWISHVKI
mgnify:CR=1 FL=1|tara:strand:- start:261 stop:1463 length:1203 start_codon:yes stop_codon:yes gene_type:complete